MRSRLLIFGYPLLEVVTAYLVALWIGWGWMLLLLVLGFPLGFAIMRGAANGAMVDAQRSARTGEQIDPARHGLTFAGGLLVFMPGFWTDLLGLLLVLPPTQRLLRRRGSTWIESRVTAVRLPGVTYPQGDVIQGTVIRTDPGEPPQPPASLP